MKLRAVHRYVGLILLFPFFGWALTGLVFFLKPGYAGAYEILSPKTYPMNDGPTVVPRSDWQEVRLIRTILGYHLLVRDTIGWHQLDPRTETERPEPTELEIRSLMEDAFKSNPVRYGEIEKIAGHTVTTSTGVEVTLDWPRLNFQQKGRDTNRIDWLYRVHYLQWTGVKTIDTVVGFIGVWLVIVLTLLGLVLAFRRAG